MLTTPAAAFCSAHWFDVHQDGFVALRLLRRRPAHRSTSATRANIKQIGYSTGAGTEVWDAYWVPRRDAKGVAIPGEKTNIVYTADAVRGIEVYEVTLPGATAERAPPPKPARGCRPGRPRPTPPAPLRRSRCCRSRACRSSAGCAAAAPPPGLTPPTALPHRGRAVVVRGPLRDCAA